MFDWVFPGSVDEKTLIEKAKTNHHDFGRLYDRFVDVVYRFVRRHVAHEQDAEDIVSDVFMAVALKIGQYETTREQKFTTRLLAIAKYKLADHRRTIYAHPENSLDDFPEPGYEADMTSTLTNTLLYERILEEIQHLPPKQGNIFCLRYIEELSNKEIAELCDIDQKTVSSVLSMVSKKIKEKIGVGV